MQTFIISSRKRLIINDNNNKYVFFFSLSLTEKNSLKNNNWIIFINDIYFFIKLVKSYFEIDRRKKNLRLNNFILSMSIKKKFILNFVLVFFLFFIIIIIIQGISGTFSIYNEKTNSYCRLISFLFLLLVSYINTSNEQIQWWFDHACTHVMPSAYSIYIVFFLSFLFNRFLESSLNLQEHHVFDDERQLETTHCT